MDLIGPVVVVEPHSDDAYLSLPATIAALAKRPDPVMVVTIFGSPERLNEASRWCAKVGAHHCPVGLPEDGPRGVAEDWVAEIGPAEVREILKAGKHLDAQRTALTFAITTDKSGVLEAAAAQAEERQATLARGQGELIAQVITRTLTDLGLPIDAVKGVIAHHLRKASDGHNLDAPAPGAAAARESIRAQLRAEWEREMARALPASNTTSDRPMDGPVPRLNAVT